MLSLVLDLARRLSQANPLSRNPLRDGEAIVLIDELDLHLHPKWQRTVVGQLTRAFPRCQFIATTHSPQIVASVQPEQVLLLRDGRAIQADRTLGLDSNWILRALMETDERPKDSSKRVRQVETCINQHFFKKARALMDAARKKGYDLPEWSVFDARIARLEAMNR
jgi:predicted ATP-binding protein involved in virulence